MADEDFVENDVVCVAAPPMMCGGYSTSSRPADDRIKAVVDKVRGEIEAKCGKSIEDVHSYKSQVVAGTNFKVKVSVGGEEYIHVSIFEPLPHTGNPCEVQGVTLGYSADSSL